MIINKSMLVHGDSACVPTCDIPQGLTLSPTLFYCPDAAAGTLEAHLLLTLFHLCVCVCVYALLSVGLGVRWPAHSPPVQHPSSQVQEAVGPGEDPTHSVHRQPLHQGELWLPKDTGWRCPHSARRLRWGLCVIKAATKAFGAAP